MIGVRRGEDRSRNENAQDTTYHWLKTHIATLPRDTGTFLTELEVAAQAGTSRTPVREALLRLEAEGLIQIVPKKGAFVPPISERDVEDVMEARIVVEDWSVRRITTAYTSPTPELNALVTELNELLTQQEEVIDDPVAFIDLDRHFHQTIVHAAGNPVLEDLYLSLRDRQVRMGIRAVSSVADRTRAVLTEHRAIVRAIKSRNTDRATNAVRTHLDNTMAILRHAGTGRPGGGH
ncbi:MAG: FCD domain-containing protein [Streptosporangiales bacterium]|nr:FCD domain-containing protein [Streptosporangiales bacterium]